MTDHYSLLEADMPVTPRAEMFPVRPGEEPWTDAEVAEIRKQLDEDAIALRADIARAAAEVAERLTDSVSDAGDDPADAGAKAFEREQELSITQNAQDLLDQTAHALDRIDAGTYGVCESCGKPIGKARLQAFPRATLCVQCKQREERR